jgi:hypothetical protein
MEKVDNRELRNLYSLPDIIRQMKSRRMRWAGHVALMGEGRNVYRVLMGKPEGKRPLARPRRRWEDLHCKLLTLHVQGKLLILKVERELVFNTLSFDSASTWPIARENFVTFIRRESIKSYTDSINELLLSHIAMFVL